MLIYLQDKHLEIELMNQKECIGSKTALQRSRTGSLRCVLSVDAAPWAVRAVTPQHDVRVQLVSSQFLEVLRLFSLEPVSESICLSVLPLRVSSVFLLVFSGVLPFSCSACISINTCNTNSCLCLLNTV